MLWAVCCAASWVRSVFLRLRCDAVLGMCTRCCKRLLFGGLWHGVPSGLPLRGPTGFASDALRVEKQEKASGAGGRPHNTCQVFSAMEGGSHTKR